MSILRTNPGKRLANPAALLLAALVVAGAVFNAQASRARPDADAALIHELTKMAWPLASDADLDPLLAHIRKARYVLLGEATHGTSEFYTWRAAISKRLIREKGFRFIAVEGDWEASYRLNRYVKNLPGAAASAREALLQWDRWPLWLWANAETAELGEWLRAYNDTLPPDEKIGFYGMDVYGLKDAIEQVHGYFQDSVPERIGLAEAVLRSLQPYQDSHHHYAQALSQGLASPAEPQILSLLDFLRAERAALWEKNPKAYFSAKQNAYAILAAEQHYRMRLSCENASWNARARHFKHTVERLMEYHGKDAKGIVWAHNTHVGNARATTMHHRGRCNIGQLLLDRHGPDQVAIVGFGAHRGAVLAGRCWDAPAERMTVPPAIPGSFEDLLHRAGISQAMLLFKQRHRSGPLKNPYGHRAIGVTYHPENEHGNYVPSILPLRYDAFIFIEESAPLTPLHE